MTKTTPIIDTPLYLAYIAAQEALDSRCEHPRMDGDTCAGTDGLAEARDAALAAYVASDEPREWTLIEAGHAYDTYVGTMAEAIEAATDNVDSSNYDTENGTIWIDVEVRCDLTGERDSATVRLDPEEPECDGDEHDWARPHALVGGIESNPGVWGHGGGVIIYEACLRCGCQRKTDTWAQADTGEQGLTSVSYQPGEYDLDELGYLVGQRVDPTTPLAEEGAGYQYVIYSEDGSCTAYETDPHQWVVIDKSDDTYTVARDEDDAHEIAYRCRAGYAREYDWREDR